MIAMPIDQLQSAEVADNFIPKEAIGEINQYLVINGEMRAHHALDSWRWDDTTSPWRKWMTEDGAWTRRFERYCYKEYETKLTPKILEDIGNILGKFISKKPVTRWFEFTRYMNWIPGRFQERPESCWWNSKNSSRIGLSKNPNGFAVLFYESEDAYKRGDEKVKGIGRCFGINTEKGMVIFNAYGMSLDHIAVVISQKMGLTYRKVTVYAHNAYINKGNRNNEGGNGGDEGLGYIIGEEATIGRMNSIDIGDITLDEECDVCHKRISSESNRKVDGKYLCPVCLREEMVHKTIIQCVKCAQYSRHSHRIERQEYCQECYDAMPVCSIHGKVPESHIFRLWHSPKQACQKCLVEGVVCTCDGCGHVVDKFNIVTLPRHEFKLCVPCTRRARELTHAAS